MGRSSLARVRLLHITVIAALVVPLVTCHTDSVMASCNAVTLAFTGQPTTLAAGTLLPTVRVEARDASAQLVTCFNGQVTLSFATNPGGAILVGGTTVSAVAGVATFSDVRIDRAGTGYALSATGAGLTSGTSASFDVIPAPASRLVFAVPPGTATVGVAITPTVVVTAHDSFGNVATSFNGPVTMVMGANPPGDTLDGITTAVAVAGIATFDNLQLDVVDTGYTLVATSGGLVADTSSAFTVAPGPAVRLVFTGQPSTVPAGVAIAPAVIVSAQDTFGNTVAGFTANVTIGIGTNPAGGAVTGTTTKATVAGVATFGILAIDKAGTGYTLVATTNSLLSATSTAFDVTGAPPTRLVFTVQPSNVTAGVAIAPAVVVTAEDSLGATVTSFTGLVTIAIGTNPAGGTLSGTMSVAAVGGVASFSTLSIDKAGSGCTLSAASSGLAVATSTPFDVSAGAATKLAFTVQPSNTVAGGTITPAVQVTAQDAGGNTANFTGLVTIAIGSNPSGGTLSGTMSVAAAAGVASFSTLSIDKSGTSYTLGAAAAGLAGAMSAAFDVTGTSTGSLPVFGHEIIVLEENHNFDQADSVAMPYLHSLIAQGGLATQYYANTHPSIGNYLWLTTGQLITNNDSYSQTISADNIVRQLLAAGKTWKSYAEDLPSVGFTGQTSGKYARKHNPLSFFSDVVNDSAQIKRLVPFTQFATDLAGDTLPNYAFVVPNLSDDAHNGTLQTADAWLQTNIAPLLANPSFQADGLLIIVFDESDTDNTNGGGRVVWAVISPKAKVGFTSSTVYQHQNTLRLMAEGLGLTSFPGAAATASNMAEFFRP
jgi:hypothetical protein